MKTRLLCLGIVVVIWIGAGDVFGQTGGPLPAVVYATGFEPAQGYDLNASLAGQGGWTSDGEGGNGLVTNFFEGFGQQAFVGFGLPTNSPPTPSLNLWRPVNYVPPVANQPLVKFSALISIVDSSTTNRDAFSWSVYNTNGLRLFTLDFDNWDLSLTYALDDGKGFIATGNSFTNDVIYRLVITMDFARNSWSAAIDDKPAVSSKPITTVGAALNLGDVDAVWAIRKPGSPGDNYMLFDDYRITTESTLPIPPRLEAVASLTNGQFLLRVRGESGVNYAIENSIDLRNWVPLKTNSAPDGVFDYLDTTAANAGFRFYRARVVR